MAEQDKAKRGRNNPRERGTAFERRAVDFAQARGFAGWERAPLHGSKDLGDVQGCVPDGLVIECKAKGPGMPIRLNEAMSEAHAAARNLPAASREGVTPVVITQRPGYPIGRAIASMEYGDLLAWTAERAQLRAEVERLRSRLASTPDALASWTAFGAAS